jgi:hypothetical protein
MFAMQCQRRFRSLAGYRYEGEVGVRDLKGVG